MLKKLPTVNDKCFVNMESGDYFLANIISINSRTITCESDTYGDKYRIDIKSGIVSNMKTKTVKGIIESFSY